MLNDVIHTIPSPSQTSHISPHRIDGLLPHDFELDFCHKRNSRDEEQAQW